MAAHTHVRRERVAGRIEGSRLLPHNRAALVTRVTHDAGMRRGVGPRV